MSLESIILSVIFLSAVTAVAVVLSRKFGLGSILGLLVAGMVIGPHSPGPQVTEEVEDIRNITEIGVLFLLFLTGLEIRPKRMWEMRRWMLGLGSLQFLVCGSALALALAWVWESWPLAILAGLTFANSSTALVIQAIYERGEIESSYGSLALSVLVMQDLALVPVLALLPFFAPGTPEAETVPLWIQGLLSVGAFAGIGIWGYYLVPRIMNYIAGLGNSESFLLLVILSVLGGAWAMHLAGLSMMLGAFVMGLLLSGSRYRLQIQARIEPFKMVLMGLFFVAVGMSINFNHFTDHPLKIAYIVVAVVALKMIITFLLCLLFGVKKHTSIRISFFLAQGSEFGFVIFGAAKGLGIIDDVIFVTCIGVISITMVLTPLLMRFADYLTRKAKASHEEHISIPLPGQKQMEEKARVILAGYGRVGHTIAAILHANKVPFIAFDKNPALVGQGHEAGHPVYYGDISDYDFLKTLPLKTADLVLLTIENMRDLLRAITHIRELSPNITIITRARDLRAGRHLIKYGANKALPEALEYSLLFSAEALLASGIPGEEAERMLEKLRVRNYQRARDLN